VKLLLSVLIGYLLGSLPFAHILARRVTGVRLAETGSGNVGTRNLARTAGLGWGAVGAVLDFSKGLAAMAIGQALAADSGAWWMLAGSAAVAGHNWPLWLRLRGGKGLATALGASAFVAWPQVLLVILIGWLVMRRVHNITVTALVCFASMLAALYATRQPADYSYFVLSLGALVALATLSGLWPPAARRKAT
jgi:glycerol-3-phosphate acyltransferase PlsY